MTTFNAEVGIKTVWEAIEGTGAIIAGGSLVDWHYGKACADIDVFVSLHVSEEAYAKLQAVIGENGFINVGDTDMPSTGRFAIDSYGRRRHDSNIYRVYKGEIGGFQVDIVLVHVPDIIAYVDGFDMNIKRAYYDGKAHYSKQCLADIKNNTVTCNVFEPQGYIRALKTAEKYGLTIAEHFDLSRQILAYAQEKDLLRSVVTAKYFDEALEMDFGSYTIEAVQAADLFQLAPKNKKQIARALDVLSSYVAKETQSSHELTNESFDVQVSNGAHSRTSEVLRALFWELNADKQPMILPLLSMTSSEFMDGKILHDGREYRVGKLLNRLEKQLPDHKSVISALRKSFETRSVVSKMRIEFSANTSDLLQVSTNKGWTSCQAWEFNRVTPNNVGVLGNLGGATVVGIFREEGDRTWNGRILVRVGEDKQVMLEDIYSHRVELKAKSRDIIKQIAKQLTERGYKVYTTSPGVNSLVSFKSLPMVFKPYNDTHAELMKDEDGWVFESVNIMQRHPRAVDVGFFQHGADLDGDRAVVRAGLNVGVPIIPVGVVVRNPLAPGLVRIERVAEDPFANGVAIEDGDDLPF